MWKPNIVFDRDPKTQKPRLTRDNHYRFSLQLLDDEDCAVMIVKGFRVDYNLSYILLPTVQIGKAPYSVVEFLDDYGKTLLKWIRDSRKNWGI